MKQTLLFVREKAKSAFIKNANDSLKYANNIFKEAKKAGLDDVKAWKLAEFAYCKPSPKALESEVKRLIIGQVDEIEISGIRFSVSKMNDMVTLPDLTPINAIIEQATENRTELDSVLFSKIKNDKNIEIDPDWLTSKLEKYSVYAENEGQAFTFQIFTEMVKSINKLVNNKNQKQYFEFLEMEGFVNWHESQFVIDTKPQSLSRLFHVFGVSEERSKRPEKELKYTGN
jgi:hypothetical protein